MPRDTQDLFALAEAETIDVIPFGFHSIRGLYVRSGQYPRPYIGICVRLYNRQCPTFRTVLAHELGHHFVGARGNTLSVRTYQDHLLMCQDEARAWRWAADFLCPLPRVNDMLRDGFLHHEIAEYFGVSHRLVTVQLDRIRTQYYRSA